MSPTFANAVQQTAERDRRGGPLRLPSAQEEDDSQKRKSVEREGSGRTGKGNPYLKGILGGAAAAAAKTDTFLGERYRRLVKRIGKLKALVAVARSILVIIWHLLADPTARY